MRCLWILVFAFTFIGEVALIEAASSEVKYCDGLTSLGSLEPRASHILSGTHVNFTCTLNPQEKYRSPSIVFEYNRGRIKHIFDQTQIEIVNNYSAILKIPDAGTGDEGQYICKVRDGDKNYFVCDGSLQVQSRNYSIINSHLHTTQENINDFSCVYYYQNYLKCSWKLKSKFMAKFNNVKTKYKLIGYYENGSKFGCDKLTTNGKQFNCFFVNVTTNSPKYLPTYRFDLYSTNKFDHNVQNFARNLSSITQLDPPLNFTFNNQTNTLYWDYPNEIEQNEQLLKFVQFKILKEKIENGLSKNLSTILVDHGQRSIKLDLIPESEYRFNISVGINDGKNPNWSKETSVTGISSDVVLISYWKILLLIGAISALIFIAYLSLTALLDCCKKAKSHSKIYINVKSAHHHDTDHHYETIDQENYPESLDLTTENSNSTRTSSTYSENENEHHYHVIQSEQTIPKSLPTFAHVHSNGAQNLDNGYVTIFKLDPNQQQPQASSSYVSRTQTNLEYIASHPNSSNASQSSYSPYGQLNSANSGLHNQILNSPYVAHDQIQAISQGTQNRNNNPLYQPVQLPLTSSYVTPEQLQAIHSNSSNQITLNSPYVTPEQLQALTSSSQLPIAHSPLTSSYVTPEQLQAASSPNSQSPLTSSYVTPEQFQAASSPNSQSPLTSLYVTPEQLQAVSSPIEHSPLTSSYVTPEQLQAVSPPIAQSPLTSSYVTPEQLQEIVSNSSNPISLNSPYVTPEQLQALTSSPQNAQTLNSQYILPEQLNRK